MFRAILDMQPNYPFKDIDVVTCKDTMIKLFDFPVGNARGFEIDVEKVGSHALFMSRDRQNTEIITEPHKARWTVPGEYTQQGSEIKRCSSHHQIAQFEFAGLTYLLHTKRDFHHADKVDGFLEYMKSSSRLQEDHLCAGTLLSTSDVLTIEEHSPTTGRSPLTRDVSHTIRNDATIGPQDIIAHGILDIESVLPRLWISQTQNLIIVYHKVGRYDDTRVKDMRNEIKTWEAEHSCDLALCTPSCEQSSTPFRPLAAKSVESREWKPAICKCGSLLRINSMLYRRISATDGHEGCCCKDR